MVADGIEVRVHKKTVFVEKKTTHATQTYFSTARTQNPMTKLTYSVSETGLIRHLPRTHVLAISQSYTSRYP